MHHPVALASDTNRPLRTYRSPPGRNDTLSIAEVYVNATCGPNAPTLGGLAPYAPSNTGKTLRTLRLGVAAHATALHAIAWLQHLLLPAPGSPRPAAPGAEGEFYPGIGGYNGFAARSIPGDRPFMDIGAGNQHACGLLASPPEGRGTAYCWG